MSTISLFESRKVEFDIVRLYSDEERGGFIRKKNSSMRRMASRETLAFFENRGMIHCV